jgi:Arc/MetJ-type ribon-helix-helix transcriptional regulator
MSKGRLTVTVDSELLEAANQAVVEGRAESMSAWVNLALAERAAKERRLQALADAVAAYEAEFGELSATELLVQERADRRNGVAVRPRRRRKPA